jgi:thiol-disulfide isomerase/thioredoxin
MRNIILIIFIIILFSFKSYENAIDNELKKFMVGQLQILELAKDKKNISNLVFKNSLGEDKSFSEFKGNILLVNFWATWCAPCIKEMPSLDRLQSKFNKNFKVLPISIDRDGIEKVKNFYIKRKIKNLDQFFDFKNTLAQELELFGLPTSFFVDKKGMIIAKYNGNMEWDQKNVVELINYLNNKD